MIFAESADLRTLQLLQTFIIFAESADLRTLQLLQTFIIFAESADLRTLQLLRNFTKVYNSQSRGFAPLVAKQPDQLHELYNFYKSL